MVLKRNKETVACVEEVDELGRLNTGAGGKFTWS
jgi:hypothetical protein